MSTALSTLQFDFVQRLKAQRRRERLTQRELADRFGVSERTLQNWEAGTAFPRFKSLRQIEAWLREEKAA